MCLPNNLRPSVNWHGFISVVLWLGTMPSPNRIYRKLGLIAALAAFVWPHSGPSAAAFLVTDYMGLKPGFHRFGDPGVLSELLLGENGRVCGPGRAIEVL